MEIPWALVNHYLAQVTVGWFDRHDLPPRRLAEYEGQVTRLEALALQNGELEAFRLGLDWLLGNPQVDCTPLNGGRYPFASVEVRDIMKYVRRTLWPDEDPPPAGGPEGVRLVARPLADWRAARRAQGA